MSGPMNIAIVALIVAVPQAALALWVMFKRKEQQQRVQEPPGKAPVLSETFLNLIDRRIK